MTMLSLKLLFFVILLSVIKPYSAVDNYVCSEDFCGAWKLTNDCPPTDLSCNIQNSTHNGLTLPSQTPCSCCSVCLKNLKQDDGCTMGLVGAPVPDQICGPGLACMLKDEDIHASCQPMTDGVCIKAQAEYDVKRGDGTLGHLMQRPTCDGEGFYGPIQCIPGQTCFCVDKEGNRIFGDAIQIQNLDITMKCECARLAASLTNLIGSNYPMFSSRCDAVGNYDIVQCMNSKCVCVNQISGSPTSNVYNLTLGISGLPCFNSKLHKNTTYLRPCEITKMERISNIYEYENNGITLLDYNIDLCQPDGYYARVQINKTHIYCSDIYGNPIDNYAFLRSSVLFRDINCNCIRALNQMIERGITMELPNCCPNGDYEKVQCRRGLCYCVDINGLQTTKQVDAKEMSKLSCYNNNNFC